MAESTLEKPLEKKKRPRIGQLNRVNNIDEGHRRPRFRTNPEPERNDYSVLQTKRKNLLKIGSMLFEDSSRDFQRLIFQNSRDISQSLTLWYKLKNVQAESKRNKNDEEISQIWQNILLSKQNDAAFRNLTTGLSEQDIEKLRKQAKKHVCMQFWTEEAKNKLEIAYHKNSMTNLKESNLQSSTICPIGKEEEQLHRSIVLEQICKFHRDKNAYSQESLIMTNEVLQKFGKKLIQEKVGSLTAGKTEDDLKQPTENINMDRVVFAGRFFRHDGKSNVMSPACEACLNRDSKIIEVKNKTAPQHETYKINILQHVSDSHNINILMPIISEALNKLRIPAETAKDFNAVDIAEVLARVHGNKQDLSFEALAALKRQEKQIVDSPRKDFCKSLLLDKDVCQQIRDDFSKNGIGEEYFNYWKESMIKDGNPTPPRPQGYTGKIPTKIDIHHKSEVKYAKNLGGNGKENLALIVQFDDTPVHNEQHYGDNGALLYRRPGEKEFSERASVGAEAYCERLVDFNYDETKADTRCYISSTAVVSSNRLKGCRDYMPQKLSHQKELGV